MILTDHPRFVSPEAYVAAVERMFRRFVNQPGVVCVSQLGHVGTPGISDIDLLVVFDENTRFRSDPLAELSGPDRYLFVHGLFAVGKEDFAEAMNFTFFHNYQLLWGAAPEMNGVPLSAEDRTILKRQIALEYLLRIFISLTVEITYGVAKLRNLFLHAKAMLYDCEFLGVTSGAFYEALTSIVRRRNQWFEHEHNQSFAEEILFFYEKFQPFLSGQLHAGDFFLPVRDEYRVGRHVRLVKSSNLSVTHRGLVLPAALTRLGGRRCFNLLHRFNEFELALPFRSDGLPNVIERAFALRERMEARGRSHFPHFLCLATNLVMNQPSANEAEAAGPFRKQSLTPLERSARCRDSSNTSDESRATLAGRHHG
jgi:hypothetical protein